MRGVLFEQSGWKHNNVADHDGQDLVQKMEQVQENVLQAITELEEQIKMGEIHR
jgi:phosphoketolase